MHIQQKTVCRSLLALLVVAGTIFGPQVVFAQADPDTIEIVLNEISDFATEGGAQLEGLESGQLLRFYVPVGNSNQEHTITVGTGSEHYSLITFDNAATSYTLQPGSTTSYDVTNDQQDDIEIYVRSVEEGTLNADFRLLQHTAPAAAPAVPAANEPAKTPDTDTPVIATPDEPVVTGGVKAAKGAPPRSQSKKWIMVTGTAIVALVAAVAVMRWRRNRLLRHMYETHWPNNDPDLR